MNFLLYEFLLFFLSPFAQARSAEASYAKLNFLPFSSAYNYPGRSSYSGSAVAVALSRSPRAEASHAHGLRRRRFFFAWIGSSLT